MSAIKQSVETLLEAEGDDNRRHVDMAVSLRLTSSMVELHGPPVELHGCGAA